MYLVVDTCLLTRMCLVSDVCQCVDVGHRL